MKHVTLQKIVAHDFWYDPHISEFEVSHQVWKIQPARVPLDYLLWLSPDPLSPIQSACSTILPLVVQPK